MKNIDFLQNMGKSNIDYDLLLMDLDDLDTNTIEKIEISN